MNNWLFPANRNTTIVAKTALEGNKQPLQGKTKSEAPEGIAKSEKLIKDVFQKSDPNTRQTPCLGARKDRAKTERIVEVARILSSGTAEFIKKGGNGMLQFSAENAAELDKKPTSLFPNLKKMFNKKTDLIYGCASKKTMDIMRDVFGKSTSRWPIVDLLNEPLCKIDSTYYTIWDEVVVTRIPSPYTGIKSCTNDAQKKHIKYMENDVKYNPNFIAGGTFPELNTRIKRGCKSAIQEAVDSDDGNRCIHVLLDGFNPMRAFNKYEKGIGYTNSEFRKIYRMWLEHPKKVDDKILFWKNDEPIKPSELYGYYNGQHDYIPKLSLQASDANRIIAKTKAFLAKNGYGIHVVAENDTPVNVAVKQKDTDIIIGLYLLGTEITRRAVERIIPEIASLIKKTY